MGMTSLFGMSAQQYGNINNERNIMNARNRNQSLIDQQKSDKRTLDDLTPNNTRLKSENKELKKQLKDKKMNGISSKIKTKLHMTIWTNEKGLSYKSKPTSTSSVNRN